MSIYGADDPSSGAALRYYLLLWEALHLIPSSPNLQWKAKQLIKCSWWEMKEQKCFEDLHYKSHGVNFPELSSHVLRHSCMQELPKFIQLTLETWRLPWGYQCTLVQARLVRTDQTSSDPSDRRQRELMWCGPGATVISFTVWRFGLLKRPCNSTDTWWECYLPWRSCWAMSVLVGKDSLSSLLPSTLFIVLIRQTLVSIFLLGTRSHPSQFLQ